MAVDLCRLFNDKGHQCHHYSVYGRMQDSFSRHVYGPSWSVKIIRKLYGYMKHKAYPEIVPWELFPLYIYAKVDEYDILHFHDLSSAMSPFTLQYLSRRNNVVWTFHDCSPITAGCINPLECNRYLDTCGECPQLGIWPLNIDWDNTRNLHRLKQMVDPKRRIQIVAPSEWMAGMIRKTITWRQAPHVINNCVNTQIYKPQNRDIIRKKLRLPQNRLIVLFMAASLNNRFKGISYALSCIQRLRHLNPFVLLVGKRDPEIEAQLTAVNKLLVGYVSDESAKSEYMSAADVMLYPSIADNFPLVVLECMASGTPVVAFRTGGIPEMITDGVNGALTDAGDVDGMADCVAKAAQNGIAYKWGKNAAKHIEERFSFVHFYQSHLRLYERMMRGPVEAKTDKPVE